MEIRQEVQSVLSTLSPTLVEDVVQHLRNELGVETVNDLKFVEPSDFPMLKRIQVRKLIASWKTGMLDYHHVVPCRS